MSVRALMLLNWIRNEDKNDQFRMGYTVGYFRAIEWQLESWEQAYIWNVMRARQQGISA